jgi:capsular polysaccharide biosynthesis protein
LNDRDNAGGGTIDNDATLDLRDYFAVLGRRKFLILAITLVGAALAVAYVVVTPPSYSANTEVLVRPLTAELFTSTQPVSNLVDMPTETQIADSKAVAVVAARQIGWTGTAASLLDHVSVENPPDTQLLNITYSDRSPERAQGGAEAFGAAYLKYRLRSANIVINKYVRQNQARLLDLIAQRERIYSQMKQVRAGSPRYLRLHALRDNLDGAIQSLRNNILGVQNVSVDPGTVLAHAARPAKPASPKPVLDIALGTIFGLFLALPIGFIRDRTDDRLRGRADIEETFGAPVLGIIPETT